MIIKEDRHIYNKMLNVFAGLKLLVPFAFVCMSLCIIFILYKQIQYKKQLEETNHKLNILFDLVRSETEKRHLDQSIQYQVREGGSGSGGSGGGGVGVFVGPGGLGMRRPHLLDGVEVHVVQAVGGLEPHVVVAGVRVFAEVASLAGHHHALRDRDQ